MNARIPAIPIAKLPKELGPAKRRRPHADQHCVMTHQPRVPELECALAALRGLLAGPSAPNAAPLGEWVAALRRRGLAGGAAMEVIRALELCRRVTIFDGSARLGR